VIVTVVAEFALAVVGKILVMLGTNVNSEFAALVPPAAVTSTFAGPTAETDGVVAVSVVVEAFEAVNDALTPPIFTEVTFVKFVPVTLTTVPPVTGPVLGLIFVTVGVRLAANVKALVLVLAPPLVVIVTSYVPAVNDEGTDAATDVADIQVLDTVVVPTWTEVNSAALAPKLVPVSVIVLVTPAVPGVTDTLVSDGFGESYEKSVLAAFVPPAVVTSTLAEVPAVPAGVFAVIVVEFTTTTDVAAVPPIVTAVAPVKSAPVIVTSVPPLAGPWFGEIFVTVGAAT
jgi:hypothetical protein